MMMSGIEYFWWVFWTTKYGKRMADIRFNPEEAEKFAEELRNKGCTNVTVEQRMA